MFYVRSGARVERPEFVAKCRMCRLTGQRISKFHVKRDVAIGFTAFSQSAIFRARSEAKLGLAQTSAIGSAFRILYSQHEASMPLV